ncbi:hypothetical protein B0T22DRAFT_457149 [Podospora appendiculata]|uniref:GTP-binding protein n=1 Tax=Podospora appendiculata TaxID=314037 RepID=A0AAE1CBG5_9PEZI|nr:hypothetical protein B0T22DRAFT_457149 [Podospora appendiculata]
MDRGMREDTGILKKREGEVRSARRDSYSRPGRGPGGSKIVNRNNPSSLGNHGTRRAETNHPDPGPGGRGGGKELPRIQSTTMTSSSHPPLTYTQHADMTQFTTMAYPPLYDPSLTINSRRFFTLPPHQPVDPDPVTRPLDTSHGHELNSPRRPQSASTTFSNPGSPAPTTPQPTHNNPSPTTASPSDNTPLLPVCADCRREATYMVEVTNYPALHLPKVRAHVLAKGDYDAVLLVYDISNRASFTSIPALHAEIPLTTTTTTTGGTKRRKASATGHVATASADDARGETAVALIGNKSDVDETVGLEKEAILQEAEVEQRSLVHPLYRESWYLRAYDDDEHEPPPLSPRSARSLPVARREEKENEEYVRRSVFSEGGGGGLRTSVFSARRELDFVPEEQYPPTSSTTTNKPPEPTGETLEKWIAFADPEGEGDGAASTATEDCTRVDSRTSDITTPAVAKRQVSRLEGETLARSLLLSLPFYETSAKTGDNVEAVFEAIVREVLRRMGREVVGLGGAAAHAPGEHGKERKMGSRRERKKEREREREKERDGVMAAVAMDPVVVDGNGNEGASDGAEAVVLEDVTDVLATVPVSHKRRRESVLGRFMKVFTKRSAVMVSDIAA